MSSKNTPSAMDSENFSAELFDAVKGFFTQLGYPVAHLSIRPLAGDGSRRRFYRVHVADDDFSCVLMENSPFDESSKQENAAYLRIAQHLRDKGLPVPEIYRFDLGKGWFIMEDLGDTSLQQMASFREKRVPIYEEVVHVLFKFQTEGVKDFSRAWTCQTEEYDRTVMRIHESNYFRDAYLTNYLGLKTEWSFLEKPFDYLAETASKAGCDFLMHRDFQSRNVFIKSGEVRIIDWQGARLGPLAYDLASLLIDPYAALSRKEQDHLCNLYLKLLSRNHGHLVGPFQDFFPYLAIQRNLQILGAFSYLSMVEKKRSFEGYITPALNSLKDILGNLNDPELSPLLHLLESIDL